MLLGFISVLIVLAVGYAFLREGVFNAFVMLCNVMIAGLVAFNFWEPIADLLDPLLSGIFLHGYEDAIVLVGLFCLTLGLLRVATNSLAPTEMQYHEILYRGGGFVLGMLTGYLTAGFLVCMMQTLPWHENFMGFDYKIDSNQASAGIRRVLPPDRVWLGLMYRAGAYPFANNPDPYLESEPQTPFERYLTFDKFGTFELRYARHRRYGDNREPLPYLGDFNPEISRPNWPS
jgi:hypothetical protein